MRIQARAQRSKCSQTLMCSAVSTRLWLNSIGGLFAASSLTMIVTPWHCPSRSPSQRTRAVVELGISSEPDARILPTTDTLVHAFSNDAILDCVDACLLGS